MYKAPKTTKNKGLRDKASRIWSESTKLGYDIGEKLGHWLGPVILTTNERHECFYSVFFMLMVVTAMKAFPN